MSRMRMKKMKQLRFCNLSLQKLMPGTVNAQNVGSISKYIHLFFSFFFFKF